MPALSVTFQTIVVKDNSVNDSILPTLRFCPKCQCETERYKDGKCKSCAHIRSKEWRLKNPDKSRELTSKWVALNKEQSDAHKAKWASENKAKKIISDARWNKDNKEKVSKKNARWRENNKNKVRANWQNRKAAKLKIGGRITAGLREKLFVLQRGKCACCGLPLGDNYHMDHIMPIALGGPNTDDNIQLLRKLCNNQKYTKHPIDFMQSRGFLL